MFGGESEAVIHLRKLGLGFIVGGLLFGSLSFVGPGYAVVVMMIGAEPVILYEMFRTDGPPAVGFGMLLSVVLWILEGDFPIDVAPLHLAGFAAALGVVTILLAPGYETLREINERIGGPNR